MRTQVLFILVLLLVGYSQLSYSQNEKFKAEPLPDIFLEPLDKPGFAESSWKSESNLNWIVYADRDGVYSVKDLKDKQKFKDLKFKEFFYVIGKKDKWLELAKASRTSVSGNKIENAEYYGWVEKRNLLLWSDGLLDETTRINKKAFLLNKASDIRAILKQEKKEDVDILSSPLSKNKLGRKTIYDFYFVMKKEGEYVLLSSDVSINSGNCTERLVGWVSSRRLVFWDTRIALEPNFDDEAFAERKNNEDLRLKAYGTPIEAQRHSEDGKAPNNGRDVIWKDDPVIRPASEMARINPKRWPGAVVRLPMLDADDRIYRTGLVGDITTKTFNSVLDTINEVNFANVKNEINLKDDKRYNYNVFFCIEGTESMASHKTAILQAIDDVFGKINNVQSIKYGAAIFRDSEEAKENKLFEIQELTTSPDKVLSFVQNAQFSRWHDNDEYSSMYYGLKRSLLEAGFNSNHTNILFVIGKNADYSAYRLRKTKAAEESDETLVKGNEITNLLSEYNVHLASIQPSHSDDITSNIYNRQIRQLIQQNASKQFQYYKDICEEISGSGMTCSNPEMPPLESGNSLTLTNGTVRQKLIKPDPNASILTGDFTELVSGHVEDVYDFVEGYYVILNSMINDGNSLQNATEFFNTSSASRNVSAGELAPAFALELKRLKDRKTGKWKTKDIQRLVDEKFQLYTEVFVPRTIEGAKHPCFSYVLYMPLNDLNRYIDVLERVENSIDDTETERREAIQEAMFELVDQFTGGSAISKKSKTTVNDLRELMQGVKGEGLDIGRQEEDFIIADILNEKKVSNETLDRFATRIKNIVSELKKISRTRSYDFSYKSGDDVYFWIPIQSTF